MKISIITLFPEVISPYLESSILKRAQQKKLVEFNMINLRDFGEGKHKVVDDRPYGGGTGMILKADVLAKALKKVLLKTPERRKCKVILTSASGETYQQKMANKLCQTDDLIIICGHYEGVDQRFIKKYVDLQVSIGDYILTGGELAALIIADSIVRLIPGVLKKPEAVLDESFSTNLLEYPQYTRPEIFEGSRVPKILLSGNHQQIKTWRLKKSQIITKKTRPDLLTRRD